MTLKTFDDFNLLGPGKLVCGVGAGTGPATFAMAERGCVVLATDRYLDITPRSDAAPAAMMVRPWQYTHRAYARGGVIPIHSDPRALRLPSNHVDGVYASGEIARLGSPGSLAAAMEEIARILKPGGVVSLTAEFLLEGPNGSGTFDDAFLLLTPDMIRKYIVEPSGLELLDPPSFSVSPATFDARAVLQDFGTTVSAQRTVDQKKDAYPNLVVFHDGFLFCPIHLTLRKPAEAVVDRPTPGPFGARFTDLVERQAMKASGVLAQQIHLWNDAFGRDDDEIGRKNLEIARLSAENSVLTAQDQRRFDLETLVDALLQDPDDDTMAVKLRGSGYEGFDWQPVETWGGDMISSVIGVRAEPLLLSEGEAGVLCYGPYLALPRGRYRVVFDVFALDEPQGTISYAAIQNFGATMLAEKTVKVSQLSKNLKRAKPVELHFDLTAPGVNTEFRLICDTTSNVAVRQITLFERRLVPARERLGSSRDVQALEEPGRSR